MPNYLEIFEFNFVIYFAPLIVNLSPTIIKNKTAPKARPF